MYKNMIDKTQRYRSVEKKALHSTGWTSYSRYFRKRYVLSPYWRDGYIPNTGTEEGEKVMAECLQSDMWNRSNVKEWTRRLVTSCRTLRINIATVYPCAFPATIVKGSMTPCVCVNEREIDNAVKRESKKENDWGHAVSLYPCSFSYPC